MIQTGTLRGHKQVMEKHLRMVRKIPLLSWTISEVMETMATNINVASALYIFSLKQLKKKLNLLEKKKVKNKHNLDNRLQQVSFCL